MINILNILNILEYIKTAEWNGNGGQRTAEKAWRFGWRERAKEQLANADDCASI
jgi:hypothetical protein